MTVMKRAILLLILLAAAVLLSGCSVSTEREKDIVFDCAAEKVTITNHVSIGVSEHNLGEVTLTGVRYGLTPEERSAVAGSSSSSPDTDKEFEEAKMPRTYRFAENTNPGWDTSAKSGSYDVVITGVKPLDMMTYCSVVDGDLGEENGDPGKVISEIVGEYLLLCDAGDAEKGSIDGVSVWICPHCHRVYENAELTKLFEKGEPEDPENPEDPTDPAEPKPTAVPDVKALPTTGDVSSALMFAFLLTVSALALCILSLTKREE